VHEQAEGYATVAAARTAIAQLPLKPLLTRVVSAHVMGGCGMAADERRGVVDGHGRHFQVDNLSVFDGSIFPTSIGANPQLSIYGIVGRLAGELAAQLSGGAPPVLA
jgi:choline dehydrogenase-like flavoprotein